MKKKRIVKLKETSSEWEVNENVFPTWRNESQKKKNKIK